MKTYIPFSGFCDSWHRDLIELAIINLNHDYDMDAPLSELHPDFISATCINYTAVYQQYAAVYCSNLQHYIKENEPLDLHFVFNNLYSPREHNFSTDVIWVDIADDQIIKLYTHVMQNDNFAKIVKARCTSRSGFHSFYSPDLSEWASNPLEWSAHQIALLFEALECLDAENKSHPIELTIMEVAEVNGVIEDLILTNLTN